MAKYETSAKLKLNYKEAMAKVYKMYPEYQTMIVDEMSKTLGAHKSEIATAMNSGNPSQTMSKIMNTDQVREVYRNLWKALPANITKGIGALMSTAWDAETRKKMASAGKVAGGYTSRIYKGQASAVAAELKTLEHKGMSFDDALGVHGYKEKDFTSSPSKAVRVVNTMFGVGRHYASAMQ
jgi:hypothetical protein